MSFRCRRSQAFIRASKIEDRRFGSAQFAAQTAALHFSMGMGDGGEREREREQISGFVILRFRFRVWSMGYGLWGSVSAFWGSGSARRSFA